jgi:hypothetical protein
MAATRSQLADRSRYRKVSEAIQKTDTRDLRKLAPPDRRRVRKALEALSSNAQTLDIKAARQRT